VLRVWDSWIRVCGIESRVQGIWKKVQGLSFRV